MTKEQLLYALAEVLTAAQILRRQAVCHDVGIDKSDAAWKTFNDCHKVVCEEIEGNLAVGDLRQKATRVTTRVDSLKHTCGIDGDIIQTNVLGDGTCQACVEESRQEKREGTIVNPVCSKCGKPMIEPLLGEPYLCTNSSCLEKRPDQNDELAKLKQVNREAFERCFEYAGRLAQFGGAMILPPDLMGRLTQIDNIIAGLVKSNQELKAINFKLHVENDNVPAGRNTTVDREIGIDSADPERLLKILAGFKADLANCYGQMGGRAMKSTLEQCQKDVDVLLELVKIGQESKEAKERYKDRLTEVTGHCLSRYTGLVDGSAVASFVNMAVNVLNAIDKHCEERNK